MLLNKLLSDCWNMNCISKEYVFINRGTKSNKYKILIERICFEVCNKVDNKLCLEWRYNCEKLKLALAPTVIYGCDSKMAGVSMPIYFINSNSDKPDELKILQGGIRFGYSTGVESSNNNKFKNGFTIQLIISKPFELIPK